MKKIVAVTAALGIMASMATSAFAAETTTTTGSTVPAVTSTTTTANGVTSTVYGDDNNLIISTPLITDEAITLLKEPIQLLKTTYFFSTPNGKRVGALSAQLVNTTGNKITDTFTGTWVEIYTWIGKSWILID